MFATKNILEDVKAENMVFEDEEKIPENIYSVDELEDFGFVKLEADDEFNLGKVKHLKELGRLMVKILLGSRISCEEMKRLSPLEKKLMLLFFEKKKFKGYQMAELSQEYVERILENPNTKKFEDNIKFVFFRMIKFLQKYFRIKLFSIAKRQFKKRFRFYPLYKQLEYAFNGYYFGRLATKLQQPIEKFFSPRAKQSSKSQFEKLIPKTLSHLYFHHVKMSSKFVRDARFYLENILMNESKHKIVHKINLVCVNWEKKLFKKGTGELIENIKLSSLFDSKCKMPWSLSEVENAIKDVLHLLK